MVEKRGREILKGEGEKTPRFVFHITYGQEKRIPSRNRP